MKYSVTSFHQVPDRCPCKEESSSGSCHPVAGAVTGGLIGAALGGPVGAFVGAVIGGGIGSSGCSEKSSDCSCSRKS